MTAWLVYAGILIYMELVFHLGSYGFQGCNPIFTLGVIALISALQALIGSCFSEKGEKIASRIMLWLQFIIFAVQAVYMHIFRQPLQLAAMFLGGQNALTNYWREAFLGVLQTTPLLVLFALPIIVLEILRKKKIWQPHLGQGIQRLRLILFAWVALVYSVCSILIGGMTGADYAEQYREYYDPATVMQEMGVPCIYVSGEEHAWNMVRLRSRWYSVDVTWDDATDSYSYFLKGTKDFRNHERIRFGWNRKQRMAKRRYIFR